jgi:hypothetical protein
MTLVMGPNGVMIESYIARFQISKVSKDSFCTIKIMSGKGSEDIAKRIENSNLEIFLATHNNTRLNFTITSKNI